jgi:NADH-quinone oxidoreductase subunit J
MDFTFQQALFYILSSVLLFAATMVVVARNPVKSSLFLVLTFFSAACIWMMLEAEFLAISLVLVYVGAVMVLFLFVVMLLDVNIAQLRAGFGEFLPIGAFVAIVMVLEMAIVLSSKLLGTGRMPAPAPRAAEYSNTRELGRVLYSDYIYPFEIAALILLVAIVAAIALTMRKRKTIKYQEPSEQMQVTKKDRLRIVKMKAEKKFTERKR